MSYKSGEIHIAVRGQIGMLKDFIEEMDAMDEAEDAGLCRAADLRSQLKKNNAEETAVLVWFIVSEWPYGFFCCMEKLSSAFPQLEIAIGAELLNSYDDMKGYFSAYSPAGAKTINFDINNSSNFWHDSLHECSLSEASVTITVLRSNGNPVSFELSQVDNLAEVAEVDDGEWISEAYEEMHLIGVFRYASDGTWTVEQAGEVYTDAIQELENEFGNDFDFNLLMDTDENALKFYPDEVFPFLEKALAIVLQKNDIKAGREDNLWWIRDDDGNEYYFGCMAEIKSLLTVDWGFPKEAAWIRF